jgi:hypothetical protein
VDPFSEGLACVHKNGKIGYINEGGELVIPCNYDPESSLIYGDMELSYDGYDNKFKDGLVKVVLNGKGVVINKKGEVIIPDCDVINTEWLIK